MIAVDTNVLVRYVTNDDPVQASVAYELLKRNPEVFVAKTVVLEMEWVLRAVYELPRDAVRKALLHVLGLPNVVVEAPEQVAEALDLYGKGMGKGWILPMLCISWRTQRHASSTRSTAALNE